MCDCTFGRGDDVALDRFACASRARTRSSVAASFARDTGFNR